MHGRSMAQQTTEDYLRGQAQQPGRGQQHVQTPGKDQKNKKKEQVDRNSASKEQQQQQQQQQQQRHQLSTAEPLPFGRPRPVRMEPPMILGSFAGRTTAGDTSGGSYEPVTASVAVAHRESDGAPAVPNRNDRTRSCSSQSNSSSSGSISSSGSGGSSDNTSGRGSLSAWEARSKLPFHMLPFEVQAYHLQQLNQPRLHLHNSQNDTGRGSGGGDGESSPPTAPMLPAEEECAVVESAWFPLMPPAMAGEARPASASPSTQRAELGAESDVGPLHADRGSLGLVENGAMTMHAWEWDTREEGHHQRNIVHLMASLSLRRTSLNSTATTNTASTTFATSSTSASSCEGGSEGEAEGPSLPGCSCLPSGSPSAFRPPPTPPRRPDSGAKSTAAAVTVPRARRQDHRSRQRQHPAAEAAVRVLGGGGGDDDVNPKAKTTKALACVALSGFVPGGGAAVVQELSLDLSNACRALASWSLTVTQVMAEEEEHSGKLLPARLADHIWPGSSALALRQRGERGGGKDGGQGGGGSQAAGARLEPRRRITRVKVKSDIGVTAASWPSTMRRLEFGGRFNSPVEGIDLPASLEVIRFGDRFNQPVSRVRWPAALLELVFGNDFNQPASGMDLPAGLRRLDFGGRFNFSVSAVDLPEELRELRFGQGFNREISNVRWPPLLSRLDFCGELQQRVEDVAWPGTLRYLALLGDFNQPIDAVKWPAGLTTVRFGDRFQQPLAAAGAARWPPCLERIVLGRGYSKSLSGCVPLPEEDGSACRSLSCARGDGGGGGLSQPVSSRRAPRVVVKCGDDDGDDGDDCGNNGVMMLAREGPLPTAEEDQGLARYAVEMTTAAAAVSAEGERPVLDGGGGDDEHYWDDEEGAEEGERGLPCLDVFGFEDCALDDMGEAWDPCLPPGSYDADDGAGRLGF
ncbi:unnamed protein product [Ectocarpus sp. 6 AP-2014]